MAQPAAVEPKPEAPAERRLSTHDKVNTTNALELLQSGTFKLVPGQDTVPYDKLMGLRLEDGIDVTRKVTGSGVESGGQGGSAVGHGDMHALRGAKGREGD